MRKRARQTDSVSQRMEEQCVRAKERERQREYSEFMRAPAHASSEQSHFSYRRTTQQIVITAH